MGLSFYSYFYLIAEMVTLGVVLLACIITFSVIFYQHVKRGIPKRDSALHGLYWAFLAFWMGTPFFVWIGTAFNGIYWVGAWILMAFLWISGFLTVIRGNPSYKNSKFKSTFDTYIQTIVDGFNSIGLLKFGLVCLAFIGLAWLMSFFTFNVCVGIHPFRVTSEVSRRMKGPSCKTGEVCNFILTVPEDLSTSIIANYHSHDLPDQESLLFSPSFVFYSLSSHSQYFSGKKSIPASVFQNPYEFRSNSTVFKMDNIVEEDRYVHWADLVGLNSSTTYFITVGYQFEGDLYFFEERKFRTAPNDGSSFTIITGGDMEQAKKGFALSKYAAQSEPLLVMVGGDLAYESGQACCYRLWDSWFESFDELFITPNGFSVPLLAAIGNHESTGWKGTREDVQFYTRYLPHQINLQSTDPINRPLFHSHHFGNDTMVMSLDSEVVETTEDQNSWMTSTFNDPLYSSKRFKLALYHIAIYPCTEVALDIDITDSARENWAPIFDTNQLTIAYENHYHLYKRTKTLKGGEYDPNGTLYIGDGAWGVNTILKTIDYDYLEKSGKIKNIIRTTISPINNTILVESINDDGDVFDTWSKTY